MSKVNYVIATWAGNRYNPANDYLKVHLKRLFELEHNLAQITIVRPLGSDNDEYYNLPEEIRSKVVIINRPSNDRSYGQFIYAYQQYTDQFDYYIIAEDDYIPNIDNFDLFLVAMIEAKKCDYLCGKYAKQSRHDRLRAIQNQGIVKAESFKKLLEACPEPKFPVMGPEDGTEQLIFSEYFTNNGMTIADYSDEYSVPYWTKTLTYFTKNESWDTIFVPYQCISKKTSEHALFNIQHTPLNDNYINILSETLMYHKRMFQQGVDIFAIVRPAVNLYNFDDKEEVKGFFGLSREDGKLFIECFIHPYYLQENLDWKILERISWENRGENCYTKVDNESFILNKLQDLKWVVEEQNGDVMTMYKSYTNW